MAKIESIPLDNLLIDTAVLSYKVSPFWGLFALGALGA
jgi:hypothetical protein